MCKYVNEYSSRSSCSLAECFPQKSSLCRNGQVSRIVKVCIDRLHRSEELATAHTFTFLLFVEYRPAFDLINGDGEGLINEDIVKTIRLLGFNPTPEDISKVTGKAKERTYWRYVNFATIRLPLYKPVINYNRLIM